MEHRLSRITTRSGDDGETGLADGQRLSKDAPRIQALGDVDELNSQIGLLLTQALPDEARALLSRIQHELFDLGGELAWPGHPGLDEAAVLALEQALEALNADLPPLREFILPGGSQAAAQAHVCRCVARRAERSVVAVMRGAAADAGTLGPWPQRYLNRLSDLLFVMARVINRAGREGATETYWLSRRLREGG